MNDNNPYKIPDSELIEETIPESFRTSSIGRRQLFYSAWLSIISLVITVCIMILSFVNMNTENELYNLLSQSLTVISSVIWIYLLIVFQKFVKVRFNLVGLGVYIKLLILMTIITTIQSLFLEQSSESGELSVEMIAFFIFFIPEGILMVLFGKKLLSIKEPYPYLKVFSWLIIVTGICFATVVLFLFAIPLGFVSDIVLALLFFYGHNELAKGTAMG